MLECFGSRQHKFIIDALLNADCSRLQATWTFAKLMLEADNINCANNANMRLYLKFVIIDLKPYNSFVDLQNYLNAGKSFVCLFCQKMFNRWYFTEGFLIANNNDRSTLACRQQQNNILIQMDKLLRATLETKFNCKFLIIELETQNFLRQSIRASVCSYKASQTIAHYQKQQLQHFPNFHSNSTNPLSKALRTLNQNQL